MSQSLSQSSSSGIDINEFPYTICISEAQINNFSAQLTIVDPSATGKARVWATEGQQGQVNYFRLSNPYGTQWQLDTYYCTYYGGTQDDPWITTLWDTQPFGQATVSIFDCSSGGGVSDSQNYPIVSDSASVTFDVQFGSSDSQFEGCVDLTNLLMGTYYGHDVLTMPSFKDLVGYIHSRSCAVAIKYGIQVPDDTRTPKVSISGYTMALKDVTPSTTVSTYGSSSDSSVDELYCNTTQYCLSKSGCHLSASRDVQRTATTTWSHDGSTQTNTAKVTRQVSVDKLSFEFGHNPNEYMQFQLGGTPAKITGKSLASAVLSDGVYMQSPISTGVIYGLQAYNWMLSQSDSIVLVTYEQYARFNGVLYYWLTQTDPDLTATTYRDVNISYTQTTKLFLDIETIPEQPKILNFINLVRKVLGLSPLQKSDSESISYSQQATAQAYVIQ